MVEERNIPALTVKNILGKLHGQLKRAATESRRSLNSEVLVRLGASLRESGSYRDEEALLERMRVNREKRSPKAWLTDEFLRKAKNQGRR